MLKRGNEDEQDRKPRRADKHNAVAAERKRILDALDRFYFTEHQHLSELREKEAKKSHKNNPMQIGHERAYDTLHEKLYVEWNEFRKNLDKKEN